MFDIGFWEVSLIFIVGLLVIGPEKLPTVARTVGLYVGKIQRFVAGAKSDLRTELESGELRKLIGDQEEQIRELKSIVSDAQRQVSDTTQAVSDSWRQQVQEAEAVAKPEAPTTTPPAPVATASNTVSSTAISKQDEAS